MKAFLTIIAAIGLSACAHAEEPPEAVKLVEPGFANAGATIPDLLVDMRYTTDRNFVGAPIDAYEAPNCLLTEPATQALALVQAELKTFGLGLKVFDCYRPATSVAHFARWAKDLDDQATKPEYYPNVPKSDLFKLGYIAERSGHSRGSTVDLTIMDLNTGEALDMGSAFDLFDTFSWPSDPRPTAQQRANRALLQSVMTKHGFRGLKEEWWHFTLNDEPYPDTYFDFPVR